MKKPVDRFERCVVLGLWEEANATWKEMRD